MIDHTGLQVGDPIASRRFYDHALAPLGYKMIVQIPKDYYGAFVLDPDGHNVEAVCHEPQ